MRSLFNGGSLGGLIKPNYGVLTLNNEDGGLDTLATYAGGGGEVTCWWGAADAGSFGVAGLRTSGSAGQVRPWGAFGAVDLREVIDRPVDSGAGERRPRVLAVAHGLPGRVGRLRGYGNAIVPAVGAAFVTAFLEAA